jgi:hypothetical protein
VNKILLPSFFYSTLLALVFYPAFVFAQEQTYTGEVKNKANEPLPNAHIKLIDEKGSIVQYCITNNNGEYSIRISSSSPGRPLWLEVTHIGYKTQNVQVRSHMLVYNFLLETEPFTLPEIEIKSKPKIYASGDTIRYDVASFTQKEDRSIGDVLRRMPGLEIASDGRISFNGKEIENLYIHGDNVMDGRYGDLPKMISKEMIESVDVIKNFQPVKVLRNKVLSNKVALNLILKDENKLKATYKTMAAAGLPGLYDGAFTPLLLSKNLKLINSIMANNVGTDYNNILSQLGSANPLDNIDEKPEAVSLSLATVGPPNLPRQTWYNNKSTVANFNNLVNVKNGLQFRINLQGFKDNNNLNHYNTSEYYLKDDTVKYSEYQKIYSKPLKLYTSANLMINKERYYFNNNIKVNITNTVENGQINLNSAPFTESLTKNIHELSNDITWIPAIKSKNIFTFRWFVNYNENEQKLLINDGLNYDITGQKEYYDTITQRIQIPALHSNAFLAYTIPGKRIVQEYKIGYSTQIQQLNSALLFKQKNHPEPFSIDSGNALNWNKENLYFTGKYSYNQGNLKSIVQLPISFQNIHYHQQQYSLNTVKRKFIFSPTLELRYDISQNHNVQLNYNYSNPFSNIKDIYKGAILMNYRLLHANDAELQENKIHSLGLNYGFENPVSMFFINSGLQYNKINANNILANEITDNVVKTILLPYNNTTENIQLHLSTSKYLYLTKSSLAVKTMVNLTNYGQLVDQELLSFQNKSVTLSASLNKKFIRTIHINYNPAFMWSHNKLDDGATGTGHLNYLSYNFEQNLSIGTTLLKKVFLEINTSHSYTEVSGNNPVKYIFTDFKARYTPKKSGIDFTFEMVNLFNVKHHTIFSNTFNYLSMSRYDLRGRMAILRVEYLF